MMRHSKELTSEERGMKTEIQDLLIERYVELKEAREKRDRARAQEIEAEITDLQREKERISECATL